MNEDETVSVSKGIFVFKNNFKRCTKRSKNKKSTCENPLFSSHLWYKSYSELWQYLENEIENLNFQMFSEVLENLVKFVKNGYDTHNEEIPTAALLTGINMPDHGVQFATLAKLIKQSVTPHVACLSSQNCQNIKYFMENMINQFLYDSDCVSDEEMEEDDDKPYVKKSQMNLQVLQCWYENLYKENVTRDSPKKQKTKVKKKPLVVILPDFESFNPEVLQKIILITSWYIKVLPFIFVFGIATSISTVHTFLPYHVSSKISLKIFKSEPSTVYLNNVLEKVFLQKTCPFHLGGKVFNLFTDIFLYYDLSVNNFIQNIKFTLLQHFCYGNAMALCNMNKSTTKQIIEDFTHEDLENVRHLISFRKLVEKEPYENRISLLTDDDYFRLVLSEEIIKIQKYIRRLHIFLSCLLILVQDLPKTPLGKQLRELYSNAVSKNITESSEYTECFQLLSFQSKEELSLKLEKIKESLSVHLRGSKGKISDFVEEIDTFLNQMNKFNMSTIEKAIEEIKQETNANITGAIDRKQFKEKLLGLSKHTKPLNQYEKLRQNILETFKRTFKEYLVEPKSFYFHEIFFYDDISIRNYIIGTHRAAIHSALNDPQSYLQCDCCTIPNSSAVGPYMPDICIAYKLHLECGKMINLYDWLQAFLSIVDPTEVEEESKRVVNPELQARFTQAVAELEYLGFIKSSKRKTDHVTRLTWGG